MHEDLFPNEPLQRKMDLHNNKVGRDYFMQLLPTIHRQFFETSFFVDQLLALTQQIKTVKREDETFGFGFVNFSQDFETFNAELNNEILEVKNCSGLRLNNDDIKKDLIRHSTIPWNSFSGLLHPTNFDQKESVPKITFGKFTIREGKRMLPISIEAHHGLVDGLHIAKYLNEFQSQLNTK